MDHGNDVTIGVGMEMRSSWSKAMIRQTLKGGRYGVITIHPSGGQPPAGLSAAQRVATLRAFFGVFSYYQLVMLFLNMVCLTVALSHRR
jgi:hypothetical protein